MSRQVVATLRDTLGGNHPLVLSLCHRSLDPPQGMCGQQLQDTDIMPSACQSTVAD